MPDGHGPAQASPPQVPHPDDVDPLPGEPAFFVEVFAMMSAEPMSEQTLDALSDAVARRRVPAHRRPTPTRTKWLVVLAVLVLTALVVAGVCYLTA